MTTYTVHVERDGQFWLVRVPEVERVTQARNLREVDAMARDLIAIMEDVDPDSFDMKVFVEAPGEARGLLDHAQQLRYISERANAAAAAATRSAARALAADGLTVRDIGGVLGVSHQRAHQLVSEAGGDEHLDPLLAFSAEVRDLLVAAHVLEGRLEQRDPPTVRIVRVEEHLAARRAARVRELGAIGVNQVGVGAIGVRKAKVSQVVEDIRAFIENELDAESEQVISGQIEVESGQVVESPERV